MKKSTRLTTKQVEEELKRLNSGLRLPPPAYRLQNGCWNCRHVFDAGGYNDIEYRCCLTCPKPSRRILKNFRKLLNRYFRWDKIWAPPYVAMQGICGQYQKVTHKFATRRF